MNNYKYLVALTQCGQTLYVSGFANAKEAMDWANDQRGDDTSVRINEPAEHGDNEVVASVHVFDNSLSLMGSSVSGGDLKRDSGIIVPFSC